ncbi:MAG: hypothetical protein MI754_08170, partial [Chromatiales bacterium]|nr:hypothetical protein [Chromatiales bacterium]
VAGVVFVALLLDITAGSVLRIISISAAILLVLLSLVLSFSFPVQTLPSPDGPNAVGAVMIDHDYSLSPETVPPRRLSLKVWYPASIEDSARYSRETLWSEFNNPSSFSAIERFFASYLKNMKTNTFQHAPMKADSGKLPILIYNHALLSIASENTFLMEYLASHGYVVISIRHKDQRAEYHALQNSLSEDERLKEVENYGKLAGDLNRSERAKISLEIYRESKTLAEIVRARARDSQYVIDNISSIMDAVPGCQENICTNGNKIGLLGLSLGGAVATELCKSDKRCGVVINMDGGIIGTNIDAAVPAPYLMLYSKRHLGGNDFLKQATGENYEERVITGADHLDFHDASFVLPGLRFIGLLGSIGGDEMIRQKNILIREFLDQKLKH